MSVSIDPAGTEVGVIDELVDLSGKTVLEVGCGDGRLTWRYANQATSVLAIDPDEERIAQAIESTSDALRSKVSFQVADITDAELPREAFDVAILAYSL